MGDWIMGNHDLQFWDTPEYTQEIEIIAVDCNLACEDEEMENDSPLPSQPLQEEKEADIVEAPAILHPPPEKSLELVPAKSPTLKHTEKPTNQEIIEESQHSHQDKSFVEGKCKTNLQSEPVTNLNVHKIEAHDPSTHNFNTELTISKTLSPKISDTKINQDIKIHKKSSPTKINLDLKKNCDTEIPHSPPPTNPLKEQNRTTSKKTLSLKRKQVNDIVPLDVSKILKREVKIVIEPLKYPEIPSKNNRTSKIDTNESISMKLVEPSPSKKLDTLEDFILKSPSKSVKISKLKLVSRSSSTQQSNINIESLVPVPSIRKISNVETPLIQSSTTPERGEVKIEMIPVTALPALKESCTTPQELIQFLKLLESETMVKTVIKPQSTSHPPKIANFGTDCDSKPIKSCHILLDTMEVCRYLTNDEPKTCPKLVSTQRMRGARWKKQAPCPSSKKRRRAASKAEDRGLEPLTFQNVKVKNEEVVSASTPEKPSSSSTPVMKKNKQAVCKEVAATPAESETCSKFMLAERMRRVRHIRNINWFKRKLSSKPKRQVKDKGNSGLRPSRCQDVKVKTQEVISTSTPVEPASSSMKEDKPAVCKKVKATPAESDTSSSLVTSQGTKTLRCRKEAPCPRSKRRRGANGQAEDGAEGGLKPSKCQVKKVETGKTNSASTPEKSSSLSTPKVKEDEPAVCKEVEATPPESETCPKLVSTQRMRGARWKKQAPCPSSKKRRGAASKDEDGEGDLEPSKRQDLKVKTGQTISTSTPENASSSSPPPVKNGLPEVCKKIFEQIEPTPPSIKTTNLLPCFVKIVMDPLLEHKTKVEIAPLESQVAKQPGENASVEICSSKLDAVIEIEPLESQVAKQPGENALEEKRSSEQDVVMEIEPLHTSATQLENKHQDCIVSIMEEECEQSTAPLVTNSQLQRAVDMTKPCHILLNRNEIQKFGCDSGYKYSQRLDSTLQKRTKRKPKRLLSSPTMIKRKRLKSSQQSSKAGSVSTNPLNNLKKYKCETCPKKFLTSQHLKRHVTLFHFGDNRPMCSICKTRFSCSSGVRRHIKNVHCKNKSIITIVQCKKCNKYFSDNVTLQKHELTHQSYFCHSCGKVCEQKLELEEHVSTFHLRHGNLSCEYCGRWFFELFHLKRHMEIVHKLETKSYCKICKKGFLKKSNYDDHLKFCGNTKKIIKNFSSSLKPKLNEININLKVSKTLTKCHQCHGLFTNIKRHNQVHIKEKPYKCPICPKEYKRKYLIKNHFLAFHKNKMSQKVKNIIESIKSNNVIAFKCYLCNKNCYRKSDLVKHIKRTHTKEEIENCKPLYKVENENHIKTNTKDLSPLEPNLKQNENHIKTNTKDLSPLEPNLKQNQSIVDETPATIIPQLNTKSHLAANFKLSFLCTICKERFSNEEAIKTHHKVTHKTIPDENIILGYKSREVAQNKSETKFNTRMYKCRYCNLSFIDFKLYRLHLKNHTLSCYVCKATLSCMRSLNKHIMNMHLKNTRNDIIVQNKKALNKKTKVTEEKLLISKTNTEYQCKKCKIYFNNASHLKKHEEFENCKIKRFACIICTKTYFSRFALDLHMRCQHSISNKNLPVETADIPKAVEKSIPKTVEKIEDIFQENSSTCKTTKEQDHKINFSELKFKCSTCQAYYVSIEELFKHEMTHNQNGSHEIVVKKAIYNPITKKLEMVERKITLLRKNIPINNPLGNEASQLKIVVNSSGVVRYECKKCSKIFAYQHLLKEHEIKCLIPKIIKERIKCNFCCKTFANRSNLNLHIRKKHGDLPVSSISNSGRLIVNKINIKDDKQNIDESNQNDIIDIFKCNYCLIEFEQNEELTKHIISKHTDLVCSKTRKVSSLGKSKKDPTINYNTFSCNKCGASFLSSNSLKIHMSTHDTTDIQTTTCPHCLILFKTSEMLNYHLMCVHNSKLSTSILSRNKIVKPESKCNLVETSVKKTEEKPIVFVKFKTFKNNTPHLQQFENRTVTQTTTTINEEIQPFLDFVQHNSQLTFNKEIQAKFVPTYQCKICYLAYSSKENLEKHETIHMTNNKTEEIVDIIQIDEIEQTTLAGKIITQENMKKYECKFCRKGFANEKTLTVHICEKYCDAMKQPDFNGFKKPHIPPISLLYNKLIAPKWKPKPLLPLVRHVVPLQSKQSYIPRLVTSPQPINTCLSPLKKILPIQSIDNNYEDLSGKIIIPRLKNSRPRSNQKINFECLICKEKYKYKAALVKHYSTHKAFTVEMKKDNKIYPNNLEETNIKMVFPKPEVNSFFCKLCNVYFLTKFEYEKHKLIHEKLQRFTCEYCDKEFSTYGNLKLHKKYLHLIDEDLDPPLIKYRCEKCDAKFVDKFILSRHIHCVHNIWEERVNISLDVEEMYSDSDED